MSHPLDHLVYATPDLNATVARFEMQFGIRPAFGGRHPGRGTMNALIALTDLAYLEIVGPSDDPPAVPGARWFQIDELAAPRLVTWAIRVRDLERTVETAATLGVTLGPIAAGSRRTAAGETLTWRLTDPTTLVEGGLVPFLIDWGSTPHPAARAPRGPRLMELRAEHPDPARLELALAALDVRLPITRADRAALVAVVQGMDGPVEIR